ncbi:MAG: HAD-IIIA family hydrolase, partial [candidate division Zixibacteria bacterium]|nr:HAD-IIIA family hydrolase [candidate division Zixibacteria bacterium]
VTLFRRILELDSLNFDLIIDLHGNFRSWFTRILLPANSRHVYPKQRLARWLVTRRKKTLPAEYPHTIDLYNETLTQSGRGAPCRRPLMSAPPISLRFAPLVDSDKEIVLISPGAAHPNKAWPVERFVAVVNELRTARRVRVVWAITSQEERDYALPSRMSDSGTIELVDCPLDQLAAIACRASLALTNDSGIGHLATAVGTPVLALFGPTHPVLGFAPRGLRDRVLQVDEPCRPCSRHGKKPCWREERFCFTRLSVASVVRAAVEMMEESDDLSPALFVDRDGTLIVNKHYLGDPEQVELLDGTAEALRLARQQGYKIIVVSNQSGIARGYHSYEDAERVNARVQELLAQHGVILDAIYFCPHHTKRGTVPEYTRPCDCRKPAPGMAEKAALEHDLDLRRSVVIGDSMADYNLGRVIGARSVLVRTGYGVSVVEKQRELIAQGGLIVAADLLHAVRQLAGERQGRALS